MRIGEKILQSVSTTSQPVLPPAIFSNMAQQREEGKLSPWMRFEILLHFAILQNEYHQKQDGVRRLFSHSR